MALDASSAEEKVVLDSVDLSKPLVALAFKIERTPHGQLTYLRTYQGEHTGEERFKKKERKKEGRRKVKNNGRQNKKMQEA